MYSHDYTEIESKLQCLYNIIDFLNAYAYATTQFYKILSSREMTLNYC